MFAATITRTAVLLGLSVFTAGHLILQEPVPYSVDSLDNSPLINAAPGTAESNFPCKLRPNAFQVSKENMITVGQSNTMTWKGSASHGGGTCQLSVTLDREPTAKSTFKVIASWIGGCPTMGQENGGTGPFNWTMPAEIPNGKATLAWNWVSKLSGQPENYMNCAPITVSGGASNKNDYDQLEDLFLVNLPSSSCGSQASKDLDIPNPGKYVTTFASTALATPTGSGCAAAGQGAATQQAQAKSGPGSAGSVGGSDSASDASGSSDGAASPSATAAPSPGESGSGALYSFSFPPGASQTTLAISATAAASDSAAATSAVSGSSDSSASDSSSSGSSGSSEAGSGSAGTYGTGSGGYGGASPTGSASSDIGSSGSNDSSGGSTGTCSTPGAVVCNGETQFGLCNFGKVVWQQVSAGTKCQNGQIQKRGLLAPRMARHKGHPHHRHN